MKIRITESQFKLVVNEVGGYDDKEIMGIHAQNVQMPLLQSLSSTVDILNSFIQRKLYGDGFEKEELQNFIQNLTLKLDMDLDIINRLGGEIYVDDDFRDLMKNYKITLRRLQNYLRVLYSGDYGISMDMTTDEIANSIMREIEKMGEYIQELNSMFMSVHGRYRQRLGLN
jgi:hypothetical protein